MKPENRSVRLFLLYARNWMRFAFKFASILCVLVALALAIQHHFSSPDIAAFEPREIGRLEAGLWRSYYEEDWVKLGWRIMRIACQQYRFSWWDGGRLALHATQAAAWFRHHTDDPRCLLALEKYYWVVQGGAHVKLDVREAARLELEWWKARRSNVPAEKYGQTIARLTGLLYGISEEKASLMSSKRAGAMAYRDARRDGKMSEADWERVEQQLAAAYEVLRASL